MIIAFFFLYEGFIPVKLYDMILFTIRIFKVLSVVNASMSTAVSLKRQQNITLRLPLTYYKIQVLEII